MSAERDSHQTGRPSRDDPHVLAALARLSAALQQLVVEREVSRRRAAEQPPAEEDPPLDKEEGALPCTTGERPTVSSSTDTPARPKAGGPHALL